MRACVPLLTIAALAVRVGAQEPTRSLDDLLSRDIGLSTAERAAVARGEVVGKVLPTGNERDVAVIGVVRINASRETLVREPLGVPGAVNAMNASQVHLFSTPATVDDMGALQVSDEDMDRLRTCRANSCDFKIPVTDMNHLRETIDWSRADARGRVEAYARQRIVDLVTAYRRDGNAAMTVSDDRGHVRSSEAFAAMLRDSSPVFRIAPSLARHLLDAPRDTLDAATGAIYWSVDEMAGGRPTLRVMDEIVYSPPEVPGTTIVAAKQIFADHYFEAGLEVLTAVDRAADGTSAAGVTVIAVRRYRFDNMPNGWPFNIRDRVLNGLRQRTAADLARLKAEYDGAPGGGPAGHGTAVARVGGRN